MEISVKPKMSLSTYTAALAEVPDEAKEKAISSALSDELRFPVRVRIAEIATSFGVSGPASYSISMDVGSPPNSDSELHAFRLPDLRGCSDSRLARLVCGALSSVSNGTRFNGVVNKRHYGGTDSGFRVAPSPTRLGLRVEEIDETA